MSTNFPTSLDSLTNPTASDTLDSSTVPHADQHANANDAIEALQAKVGVNSSAVATSLDYKVTQLELHLTDTVDAHDASAISFSPTGTIASTDVQAAIAEVASEAVSDHGALTGLGDDDHPQYGAIAQNETVSGSWTFSNPVTIGSQLFLPKFVRKTSTVTRTSTTVLADDADLLFAVGASETWIWRAVLFTAGGQTGDIKLAWTAPASPTAFQYGGIGLDVGATSTVSSVNALASLASAQEAAYGIVGDTSATRTIIIQEGIIVNGSNAGNVTLQWAQNVSNATGTVLRSNSFIFATRVV